VDIAAHSVRHNPARIAKLATPFDLLAQGWRARGHLRGRVIHDGAHLEGKGSSVLDYTALRQNSDVLSFIRIGTSPDCAINKNFTKIKKKKKRCVLTTAGGCSDWMRYRVFFAAQLGIFGRHQELLLNLRKADG